MLKTRMRRLVSRESNAAQRMAEVETALRELGDEDLLDLADIFRGRPQNPLSEIAAIEMTRRNISL